MKQEAASGSDKSSLLDAVLAGLATDPPYVPTAYLYDERGADLFEAICQLEEYYPYRCELALMDRHLEDIVQYLPRDAHVIEFGSGAGEKSDRLLAAIQAAAFTPIDIAAAQLHSVAQDLRAAHPDLAVMPYAGDFTTIDHLPDAYAHHGRRVVYFPGSTIGNFDQEQAVALLRNMRQLAGDDGCLLIGFDRDKDPAVINAAYNDSAGVTAAFNCNIIRHLNNDLGHSAYDESAFRHYAAYDQEHRRLVMELHVVHDQSPQSLPGLKAGTVIHVEYSHKYSDDDIQRLFELAGLQENGHWQDEQGWFSLICAKPV